MLKRVPFIWAVSGSISRAARSEKARHELLWVAFDKLSLFVLNFVALKVFTQLLDKDVFGEWRLAIVGVQLVAALTFVPMRHVQVRVFHESVSVGQGWAAAKKTFAWYCVCSVGILALAVPILVRFADGLGVGVLTIAGAGLFLVGNEWRTLAEKGLEASRRRRTVSLLGIAYNLCQVALAAALAVAIARTAGFVMLGMGTAAMCLASVGIKLFCSELGWNDFEQRSSRPKVGRLVLTFGLPFGALFLAQWFQNFADRYIVAYLLGKGSAGLYSAGSQVCGAPYILLYMTLSSLLLPIAYEHSATNGNANSRRRANRVLGVGFGVFMAFGSLSLILYGTFGPELLRLLTTAEYRLSPSELTLLALSRMCQQSLLFAQLFFAVHNRVSVALLYRLGGACLAIVMCWFGTKTFGLLGAAAGSALASGMALLFMVLGPRGVVGLLRESVARANTAYEVQEGPDH